MIDSDPYEIDLRDYTHPLSSSYEESRLQQNLLDLLHAINGRQLSILKTEGERWYAESAGSFQKVTEMAKGNLKYMLNSWHHVESLPYPKDGTTASLVHGFSLEWGVRTIVNLFTELEVQKGGLEKYRAAYQECKLWWQLIMVY